MKLPSIQQVVRESSLALRRFPLVLIDAFLWTVTVLILVDHEGPPSSSILFKVMYATILGFPLLLAVNLVAERRHWQSPRRWGIQTVCGILLAGYAITVPGYVPAAPEYHNVRMLLLFLAVCLLVATGPYARVRQVQGFWQYSRSLIQRILLTGVFSLTLYAGLALALGAVDQLFGVHVPGKRYAELGLCILGVFATWVLLAGVPRDLNELDSRTDYPRVLRVFGQYILVPLLLVYFVILYAYIAKIIIEWSWPKGIVSGLIFGFAATGIAAYLLLYPMRDTSEYNWLKRAARWFWIVMIPMIVVLELAIWRRVSEYGITENRYFAFALGVWLAAMIVYFLASRTKSIKVIPASICVLALLVSFGPWGVFHVSEASQVGRLESLLTKNELLIDGKAQKARTDLDADDVVEISSIIRYLHNIHGYGQIRSWFSQYLKHDSTGIGTIDETPADVVALLGLEYTTSPMFMSRDFHSLTANTNQALDIGGYDHLLMVERLSPEMPAAGPASNDIAYSIDSNLNVLTARAVHEGRIVDSVQFHLWPLVDSLFREYGQLAGDLVPAANMTLETMTKSMRWKVIILRIDAHRENDAFKPTAYDALILYAQIRS